ncbi:DUF333 domain-containing protein [Candidatus Sodalis endolongispinus]|uniref:DUF333 domain-containing protein n=1 Tax=Candidatus Sodalis endolongispinus TaxID=2812662 RepID=A0ABS5YDV1_9GAMM|nr:DUF333 domain-containing protein [Candidatus Sodalis endolongispinus]MBT9433209.1 DUF333 domain-containing protein [Candidatus Sodalis endolongispinus]
MTLSRWVLATSVVLLVACSSDPSVNDEPEQQGTAVRMQRPVLSQAEQAACSGVGGTLTAALQLDGSTVVMCQLTKGRRLHTR